MDVAALLGRLVTEAGMRLDDVIHYSPSQVAAIYRGFRSKPRKKFGSFAEAVAWMRANGRVKPKGESGD